MNKQTIYFAYGSNINRKQMAQRCPFAEVMGSGFIEGQELQFKGVATIAPNKKAVTPVLAWKLSATDEASLDIYEGYPNMYIKKTFDVELNGKQVTGMAYVMNKFRPLYVPAQSYFDCIVAGYKQAGMNIEYLKKALKQAHDVQVNRQTIYIAYGSNTNQKPMGYRCPDARVIAKATIPDYELQFKQYATIEPSEGLEVPALIWRISADDEFKLDRYESYPNLYRKEFFEYKSDKENTIAMAYIMNGRRPLQAPHRDYYNGILEGYRKMGLDESVLENAYQKAVAAEQELKLDNDSQCFGQIRLW